MDFRDTPTKYEKGKLVVPKHRPWLTRGFTIEWDDGFDALFGKLFLALLISRLVTDIIGWLM